MSASPGSQPTFYTLWLRASLVAYPTFLLVGVLGDGLNGLAIRAAYGLVLAPLLALLPSIVWWKARR